MGHNYYWQDVEEGNRQRLEYFDDWFETLASEVAKAKGITLSTYLSQITNLTSFKAILEEVFGQDTSLGNYVEGMSQRDFKLFFQRPLIQDIVEANKEAESERIEEIIPKPRPIGVEQVAKKTRTFFMASYMSKKTGKRRRTVGYEDEVTIRKKKIMKLRDSSGRFVKRS
jgi:hypothetical protein